MQGLGPWYSNILLVFEKLAIFGFYTILIYITGFLLKELIKKFRNYSPTNVYGIILFIDVSQLFLWVSAGVIIIDFDPSLLIGGSALIVVVIGLSAGSFGDNIVSGIYLLLTRPYGIGDLIVYNNNIGIIYEIGLLQTTILRLNRKRLTIPNSVILNSSLQNFNIQAKYVKKHNSVPKTDKQSKIVRSFASEVAYISSKISASINQEEVIRFTFPVELRLDEMEVPIELKNVTIRVKKVLDSFNQIFGFDTEFYYNDFQFRLVINIVVTSRSINTIYENYPVIIEKLVTEFYDYEIMEAI